MSRCVIVIGVCCVFLMLVGCTENRTSSSHSGAESQPTRVVSRPGSNPLSGNSNTGSFREGSGTGPYPVTSSTESKTVYVSARTASWQSTGMSVNAGDDVSLSASGSVIHWKSGDGRSSKSCGPNGVSGSTNENVYLAPGLRKMGLVGKIHGYVFDVGSSKSFRSSYSGTLYLGMNDTVHYGGCADNEGSWTVRVTVERN
jgi:hypothetical protein